MAISPFPTSEHSAHKIRPINYGRDMNQVVRLLNQVFSPTLDAEGRRALQNMNNQPPFLLRLQHLGRKTVPGFVWDFNGRVVGNISIVPTQSNKRVIIANVAVQEDFRRQGIARQLMDAALDHLETVNIKTVHLQVDVNNDSAIRLYESLGFKLIGSTTYWVATPTQMRELAPSSAIEIRPLRHHEQKAAYDVDLASYPADMRWPEPLTPETYKSTFWKSLNDALNGRQRETWVVETDRKLRAVASIDSDWGRPHRLAVRIPEADRQTLTLPMLSKLLRRIGYLRRRYVSIEHPIEDELMANYLVNANFRPKRHLSTMKLVF